MAKKVFQRTTPHVYKTSEGTLKKVENQKLHQVFLKKGEKFFETFYRTLASFYDLRYTDDLCLLIELAELADNTNGKVLIPPPVREELCAKLNIHTTNLSKSLKRLKEKNLITGERGVFIVSEHAFWRGDIQDVKQFTFTIQFKYEN